MRAFQSDSAASAHERSRAPSSAFRSRRRRQTIPIRPAAGDQRGAEEPFVERNSEDVGWTASCRLECGQQSRHPGAGVRELPQLLGDGAERLRHFLHLLRPPSTRAQLRVDGRELGVQGGEDGKGRAANDFGGKGPARPETDVEKRPRAVQAPGLDEARAVHLLREQPRGDGQDFSRCTSARHGKLVGEGGRQRRGSVLEGAGVGAQILDLGPRLEDPPPLGSNGVESRAEARPLDEQIVRRRPRGDASEDLQRSGAQGGEGGRRRNRARGKVVGQIRNRARRSSLLVRECVTLARLGQSLEANDCGGGEDDESEKECDPAKDGKDSFPDSCRSFGGRPSARRERRNRLGHAQENRYRGSDNEQSAGVSAR